MTQFLSKQCLTENMCIIWHLWVEFAWARECGDQLETPFFLSDSSGSLHAVGNLWRGWSSDMLLLDNNEISWMGRNRLSSLVAREYHCLNEK